MSLINDLATLRKFVKFSFTTTEKNLPDIAGAEREYLLPILGLDLLQNLRDQVQNSNITFPFLLELCRAAIAPLAFYIDLALIQTSIEDSGLKTTTAQNKEAAHQWEYKEVQNALLNKGTKALEMLIKHLIAKGTDYQWEDNLTGDLVIKTGAQFSQLVYLNQPNLTYNQLKPLILEVQDHLIKPGIGEAFFNSLINLENLSAEENKALLLICKVVANHTIARAAERLPVKITPNGLLVTLETDQVVSANPASDTRLHVLQSASIRDAESYYLQLKDYLNKTASQTLFEEYFSSDLYVAPKTNLPEPNDSRNGIVAL